MALASTLVRTALCRHHLATDPGFQNSLSADPLRGSLVIAVLTVIIRTRHALSISAKAKLAKA